jgi:WD40 repeat protein
MTQVWDADTGQLISGPFEHTSPVRFVGFYQGCNRIISGVDKMRDITTGEVVSGPFEGHTNAVSSVALSLDGNPIVSGSYQDDSGTGCNDR